MKITVIDFETANYHRASACAIGIVQLENGAVVAQAESLIRPPPGYRRFIPQFIDIHGIYPTDVQDAPDFDEVFEEYRHFFTEDTVLAAHNAPFDMSVLGALMTHYRIPYTCDGFCTMRLARNCWPHIGSFGLANVARHLGVALQHHQAASDANAAAAIVVASGLTDREKLRPYMRRYNWQPPC